MMFRTGEKYIYESLSEDAISWNDATPSAIPNPNSKIFMMNSLDRETLILACNPVSKHRTPMSLEISKDQLATWENYATLDDAKSPGNYAYPTSV